MLALLCAVLLCGSARAQVSGTVTDLGGSPIAGARVGVRGTGLAVRTGSDGTFSLPDASGRDLVIAAAAVGYFNEGEWVDSPTTDLVFVLAEIPESSSSSFVPYDSGKCVGCHSRQVGEWLMSTKATADENRWVADFYDGSGTIGGEGGFVYTRDSATAASHPDSECRACHQPAGWMAAPQSALDRRDPTEGITCEICHQMAAYDLSLADTPGLAGGAARMASVSPSEGPVVQFGVLGDALFQAPPMRPAYQPQLLAEICASCHQARNDHDGDGDFTEEGGLVVDGTFDEWAASPYGDPDDPMAASCVGCHMPVTPDQRVCVVESVSRPDVTLGSHRIRGTTPDILEQAVSLSVNATGEGGRVLVTVDLTNDGTGHHVPTGSSLRNVILLVEAFDAETGEALEFVGDQVVHDLGGVGEPAEGYFAGLPGKLYARVYADADGAVPAFDTEARSLSFDTRVPALETDTTTFAFKRAGAGSVTASARLVYRRAFRPVVDEKEWTTDGFGEPLADITGPDFGVVMASAEITAETPGGCGCQATPGSSRSAAVLLLFGAAWLVRTRRRHS